MPPCHAVFHAVASFAVAVEQFTDCAGDAESALCSSSNLRDARMRNIVQISAAAGLLLISSELLAQQSAPSFTPSHRAVVQRLMEVSRVRETSEQSTESIIAMQAKQMPPGASQMRKVFEDFLREHMNWKVLEPEYVRVYLETFSESEANDLVVFYQTPVGKLLLAKTPILMTKSQEMSQALVQRTMPEMMKRMQAAVEARTPDTSGARLR
jgi:uncharacterized protein